MRSMDKETTIGLTRGPFKAERKQAYVEALEKAGEHVFARMEVGVSHQTIALHRREDAEFAQACEDALHSYRKTFIDELVRRGVNGVEKPVFHNGEIVGHVTEYSDRLLMEHLKVIDKRYRDKLEIDMAAHITSTDLNLDKLQPESRILLQQILEIEATAQTAGLLDAPNE